MWWVERDDETTCLQYLLGVYTYPFVLDARDTEITHT